MVTALCPGFVDTLLSRARRGGVPLRGVPAAHVDDIADALDAILDHGEPGECWYMQPGREPRPYEFRSVPGAQGGNAESQLFW